MSADWLALGPFDAAGWRGYRLCGSEILAEATEADEPGVLRALKAEGDSRLIRIGAGQDKPPAALLPDSGAALGDMVQEAPLDRLSGWARLAAAGVVSTRNHWDGVICHAGRDVTHWLQISAEEIVSFQGSVTARLIAALGGAAEAAPAAVEDALARPEKIALHLRRAEMAGAAADVTGALIGAELAALRPYWLGQAVIVLGGAEGDAYAEALRAQGVPVERDAPEAALRQGLAALAQRLGLAEAG
ncbi:2-dehydro-3-deoxygalactonokinase [Roseovarius sp. CH_XMU1461]|uniref:2-dehydro-3-deoxygalactonokinase n=1 Tax=Roseovarius sp. CH_XMU1461 TaxID=3107777 RepID=UPI003008F666